MKRIYKLLLFLNICLITNSGKAFELGGYSLSQIETIAWGTATIILPIALKINKNLGIRYACIFGYLLNKRLQSYTDPVRFFETFTH